VVRKVITPPTDLTSLCLYTRPEILTQKQLYLYTLYLEEELEGCNLKQEKELQWFNDLKEKLQSDERA